MEFGVGVKMGLTRMWGETGDCYMVTECLLQA